MSDKENTPSNMDELVTGLHVKWIRAGGPPYDDSHEDFKDFVVNNLADDLHGYLYDTFIKSFTAPPAVKEAMQASVEAFLASLDGQHTDFVDAVHRAVEEVVGPVVEG
jgi:hypothetical protein